MADEKTREQIKQNPCPECQKLGKTKDQACPHKDTSLSAFKNDSENDKNEKKPLSTIQSPKTTPSLQMNAHRTTKDLEELFKPNPTKSPLGKPGEIAKEMAELAKNMLGDPQKRLEELQALERHRRRINPFSRAKTPTLVR